jgi:hypothetical protein
MAIVPKGRNKVTANPVGGDLSGIRQPDYLRNLFWDDSANCIGRTATLSEYLSPLPGVPEEELENEVVTRTIADYPQLFQIITPINIDRFESLLTNHPNPAYVQSVLRGLREGFWPWANTNFRGYPLTQDYYQQRSFEPHIIQFLCRQRDDEIRLGRFSQSFGRDLLPGMYAMPLHVIPKPNSTNFRLITDLSAGTYAPNTMIQKSDVANLPMDSISELGAALIQFRQTYGNDVHLVMWKSDVSQAYRRMPMHKRWQIKQIHTIEGERYVDRCNNFGGKGGYGIWSAFMSLVVWIGWNILMLRYFIYVDDNFGFERAEAHMLHARLNRRLPMQQVRLLELWDEIGLPYESQKQEWGDTLRIIGFDVDPNAMSVTIPDDSRATFLHLVANFIDSPPSDRRHTLREFQALAGHANWILNIYQLGRPGLCALYNKIAGKFKPNARIYLNQSITRELHWLVDLIQTSPPVRIFNTISWDTLHARAASLHQLEVQTDASGHGLAYYFPSLALAYFSPLPVTPPADTIFWFEALAVCSAINHAADVWASGFSPKLDRLHIRTDNTNTVNMFNTLRAQPPYNPLLISSIDARRRSSLDVRTSHIPGAANVVADAVSRKQFELARRLVPTLTILTFQPPRDALGAIQK